MTPRDSSLAAEEPSFLLQLCDVFGWTPDQATLVLGEWLLASDAGLALRRSRAFAGNVRRSA